MSTPHRNGIDLRAKNYAPRQRLSDYEIPAPLKEATPPLELDDVKATMSLLARGPSRNSGRLRLRISIETYLSMGSPARVSASLSETDSRKLIIRKSATGMKVCPSKNQAVIDFSRKKLGMIPEPRGPVHVPCEVYNNRIVLSDLPNWFAKPPASQPAENADNAETPAPAPSEEPKPDADLSVRVSVQRNGNSMALRFAIPMSVMGHMGDPKRVFISGTAHQGFKLEPTFEGGVIVNYSTGNYVYLLAGMLGRGLSKDLRKAVTLKASHKGDTITVAGPPHEWINVGHEFRVSDEKPAPIDKPKPLLEGPLLGQGTSPPPKVINEPALVVIGDAVQALKDRLSAVLAEAVRLREELSQKTGLQFVITAAGKLMVK